MNIKNLFKKTYNGVQLDTRNNEEKAKDYTVDELYSFASGSPFRKVNELEWAKYEPRTQSQQSSCVANTAVKILEAKRKINNKDIIKFSHGLIYTKRNNKPAEGMNAIDAFNLAIKYSACKESDMPSEYLTEKEINNIVIPSNYEELNNYVKPTNYVISKIDFNTAANLVNKEGAAMIWFNTSYNSWNKEIPIVGGKDGGVRHSVTIVDAILLNDIEYLVIEDSWGLVGKYNGQRLITREFFNECCYFVGTLTEFKYDVTDIVDKETFNVFLELGQKSEHVKKLQDFLKTQGTFPINQDSTGFYGRVTSRAVYLFQVKNNVDTLTVLDQLKGKRCGLKTITKINEIITK